MDCGSTLDSPVTQEVLRDLDALIVVSSPWVDGASVAAPTMGWPANHGLTDLLQRTIVVLNGSGGHADRRTRTILAHQFADQMSPKTRRRFYEIAAALADHFSSTSQGRREQRSR